MGTFLPHPVTGGQRSFRLERWRVCDMIAGNFGKPMFGKGHLIVACGQTPGGGGWRASIKMRAVCFHHEGPEGHEGRITSLNESPGKALSIG